ncbi:MAG: hypothetical protein E5W55_09790 [Mesorhizobium sp.]|nr:MAG: hypothetical protein E5W55_09790 [Mesorhizobium sp.]
MNDMMHEKHVDEVRSLVSRNRQHVRGDFIVDIRLGIPKGASQFLVGRLNPLDDPFERGVGGLDKHNTVGPGDWQGRDSGMGIHDERFLLEWRSLPSAFSVAMPTLVLEGAASPSARRRPCAHMRSRRIREYPTDAIEGSWRRIRSWMRLATCGIAQVVSTRGD